MTDLKSQINFTLSSPISVQVGGGIVLADDVILYAPSNRQRNEAAKLKQGFYRAMKDMQSFASASGRIPDASEVASDEPMSGAQIISALMMSSVDMVAYQESFRLLVTNDACTINNVKLTSPLFDMLSDSDTEKMMGEYIANFLLSSLNQAMTNK